MFTISFTNNEMDLAKDRDDVLTMYTEDDWAGDPCCVTILREGYYGIILKEVLEVSETGVILDPVKKSLKLYDLTNSVDKIRFMERIEDACANELGRPNYPIYWFEKMGLLKEFSKED